MAITHNFTSRRFYITPLQLRERDSCYPPFQISEVAQIKINFSMQAQVLAFQYCKENTSSKGIKYTPIALAFPEIMHHQVISATYVVQAFGTVSL